MSYETERDVIRQRFNSGWAATTAVDWSGFNGSSYDRSSGTEFVRPRCEDGEAQWVGIGGQYKRARKFGTLVVEVFQPAGTGEERGVQLCDSLIAIFTPYSSSGVSFMGRGFAQDVGSDGNFHKWIVFLPYYFEAVVPVSVETVEGVAVLQTLTAHGFVSEDLIRWNGTQWTKALATASTTLADAIVTQVINANQFLIQYLSAGEVSLLAHGLGAGGTALYLSASTAGLVTSTAPSAPGEYVQQVGRVKDANTLILQESPAEVAA